MPACVFAEPGTGPDIKNRRHLHSRNFVSRVAKVAKTTLYRWFFFPEYAEAKLERFEVTTIRPAKPFTQHLRAQTGVIFDFFKRPRLSLTSRTTIFPCLIAWEMLNETT